MVGTLQDVTNKPSRHNLQSTRASRHNLQSTRALHSKNPQPYNVFRPIFDTQTKNRSFVEVHEQLKMLGVKNNKFHLILLNPLLQGVDPYDPNLTPEQVMMIVQECKMNMFYYLREVVRIEEQGGNLVMFRMDRGTLAAAYHFYNNINHYLMKPRQTGKTIGIVAMLSWAFKFSGPNGDFLYSCYKEDLAKRNLRAMKTILSNLPSYLSKMGTVKIDNLGKAVRKTDNIKTYREPVQNNQAMVANCASTEDAAETIGRGFTQIYQFFDEAEFTKYIDTIVKVSGMSFNTASRNARNNGSGYCRIFATTPGDLGNVKACQSAMKIVNDALVWKESFYDVDILAYKRLIKKKSKFRVVYIEYDYRQLGLGEDWFIDACSNVGGDINKIKREILLQRFSGNNKSPFTQDEIEDIDTNQATPIARKVIGKIYEVLFYEKPRKKRLYFMGLDPSDGTGGDNYAFTIIDPYTLKIVAEFRSQYMTVHGCVDLVTWLVDNYFPNIMIVIERNRNGGAVVEEFKRTKLRNRIYSSPEANADTSRVADKLDENGFIKESFVRNKYFGTNTTPSTRQVMMNILLDAVHFARHLVNSRYVVEDVKNLVIQNNKIQAAPGKHDDNVMSWLIVMYVYYYGEKLERYGFTGGTIPNDVEESDEFAELRTIYKNPEIKKQFPTLYNFYLHEVEKHNHIDKVNQLKEDSTGKDDSIRIGGLRQQLEEASNDIIPDIDGVSDNITGTSTLDDKRRDIVQRFLSLNYT